VTNAPKENGDNKEDEGRSHARLQGRAYASNTTPEALGQTLSLPEARIPKSCECQRAQRSLPFLKTFNALGTILPAGAKTRALSSFVVGSASVLRLPLTAARLTAARLCCRRQAACYRERHNDDPHVVS